MNWLELSIETSNELAEAISDALFEYVEGGVVIEQFNDATRSLKQQNNKEDIKYSLDEMRLYDI